MRVLLGAGAAVVGVCGADKAAYSLDLIGIDSGTAYTVEVNVGTTDSANTFRLIADTGSSNDAVLGEGCCGSTATTTYSCDDSSTCSASSTSATLAFAGATIAGHYVTDKWLSTEFGTITKEFLVIDKQDTFYRTEYDGITGLAYKALAKPKDSPKTSFYENLVVSKSGIPDAFGMQLCGIMQPILTQTNYSLHAGQWLVGGSEGPKGETYYKDSLLYTPIAQEAWYVVVVTDIGFDGQSLGLPCSSYNNPQAIIDSGTSNIAFPSDVYNALMTLIKAATKKQVPDFADTYFDYRKSCCGKDYCDPTDASLALLKLPSIYITLALQEEGSTDTTSHYTVEIPPEYYFRPEMNGANTDTPCRAMGVAESTAIVLGDVFMDGLFAFHDRANGKIGLAVTENCPNGVKSTKKVTKATNKKDDWCDCFSDSLKDKSSLVRYVPWGSGCFFMPWWMYVVIASVVVVLACVGILGYWYWKGRQDKIKGVGGPAAVSAAPLITPQPTDANVAVPITITTTEAKPDPIAAASAAKARQSSRTDRSTDDAEDHYTMMASPRHPIDSGASSIALLTSSDDVSSGVDVPTRAKSQQQLDATQGRTIHHGSGTRETDGFLL